MQKQYITGLKDTDFYMMLYLANDSDIGHLCQLNKGLEKICESDEFWETRALQKFPEDFNYFKAKLKTTDSKKVYRMISDLLYLKKTLHLKQDIREIWNLKTLNLPYMKLKEIPKEIGNLVNLESLDLQGNHLEVLPKEIGNLVLLKGLFLQRNQLKELPKEIGNLVNLENFHVNNNKLKELPNEIENLVNLKYIFLYSNKIEKIPQKIENVIKRQTMHLPNFNEPWISMA